MDQVLSMPGFRFHPTDVELINYFLKRKVSGRLPRVEAITEIDLYKYEPWDLPGKSCQQSRDLEWYFFSPRSKKYPNGHKKERSTKAGHWKTNGKGKEIYSVSQQSGMRRRIGMKKTLVYYTGRAPRGNRTNWVMHEYRLEDKLSDMSAAIQDSYVICRVFQKSGAGPKTAEEYGAPFREEDWDEETSAEAGAAFSSEKDSIACDPNDSTLSHANNNVTVSPGVAQELDDGVIILDKNYAPTVDNIEMMEGFLSKCLNYPGDPKLNLNRGENLQQGTNKDKMKSDEIFEGLEDIGMDVGVLGSASFDQFLPETHESSRDDFGVPSMAWYQNESANKNTRTKIN